MKYRYNPPPPTHRPLGPLLLGTFPPPRSPVSFYCCCLKIINLNNRFLLVDRCFVDGGCGGGDGGWFVAVVT